MGRFPDVVSQVLSKFAFEGFMVPSRRVWLIMGITVYSLVSGARRAGVVCDQSQVPLLRPRALEFVDTESLVGRVSWNC